MPNQPHPPSKQQPKPPSLEWIRFGIPSLDHLFSPARKDPKNPGSLPVDGVRLASNSGGDSLGTSLSLIGRSGTGKSLLVLHLASRYCADSLETWETTNGEATIKPLDGSVAPPKVLFVSTDLTHSRAEATWNAFGLNRPNERPLPFGEGRKLLPVQQNETAPSHLLSLHRVMPGPKEEDWSTVLDSGNLDRIEFIDLA